jgi:DNA-binding transcriptional MerR regulator
MNAMAESASHTLNELCMLADLPVRTVRYYVQHGLIDRPVGETRAARYGTRQLEQLLLIKKWTTAGVSLDRIRGLLQGEAAPLPAPARQAGSVEVHSHLHVADGLEIVIAPGRAQLSPEQVRAFTRGVMALHASLTAAPQGAADSPSVVNQKEKQK